jgi:hypothetical protein
MSIINSPSIPLFRKEGPREFSFFKAVKVDEAVKSQKSDGTVKSFRCKARKSDGMRRTYRYAAMTEDAAQRRRWTFYEAVKVELCTFVLV